MTDFKSMTFEEMIEEPALLAGFSVEYAKTFGSDFCIGCEGNLRRAWHRYQQKAYIEGENVNQNKRIMSNCKYKIKDGVNPPRMHNSAPISNADLTDAKVERLLETHPKTANWFEMADGSELVNPVLSDSKAIEPTPDTDEPIESVTPTNEPINATKSAIDYAASNGIDLSAVTGSGKDGRIQLKDLK